MSQKAPDLDIPDKNRTPFITATDAYDAYDESRKWLRRYFEPMDEFERIARNKPSNKIDPSLPRVTDGTLAAIIQEQPKRVIQQLATGKVSSPDYPEYAAIADIILQQRIIPMYNRMGDGLQKQWSMLGKALTYGMATSYTFFTSSNGKMHTDYVIPYVKDVLTEKGKVYAPDSNIAFMRSWYQKRDLKAIINREKHLESTVKDYKTDWNLSLLSQFMDQGGSTKPADQQTPAEKEKGGDNGGYEVIHAFQKGVGAELYSFSPQFKSGENLRTKLNKDPRGHMPLDFLYNNIDLSNPLGRGQVELSGGVQNLIDQQMQMFQFMSTLEMGPPLQVWGNPNKASLKFRPNALWDMGTNPANKVEPYVGNNNAMQNFPNNYSLLKSQIMNLNSSQDHSMSASAGNIAQSKTSAGVQASEQKLGVSDNYLRKQAEAWIARQSETSINIFFSEMTSTESIELGPQQVRELKSTPAAKFIKGDKLEVNYKEIENCIFTFKVDPSSSKTADDQEQLQRLQELSKAVSENPLVINYYLGQDGKKLSMGEIYTQMFKRMGLENLDSILTDMDQKEAEQAKQQPFPIVDKPQFRVNTADLTAEQIQSVLALGGVQPSQGQPQPGMPPGLSPQGVADFMVEMTKAQATGAQPQGMNPDELALKQHELAIKTHDSVSKAQLAEQQQNHQEQQATVQNQQAQQQMDQQQQQNQAQNQQADQQMQMQQQQAQTESGQPAPEAEPATPDGLHAIQPHEEQLVHDMLQRGFSEQDVEQAMVMIRRGMSVEQVYQTLGAKYKRTA